MHLTLASLLSQLLYLRGLHPSLDAAKRALFVRLPTKKPWALEVIVEAYTLEAEARARLIASGAALPGQHPAQDP
jgi:hypothetical protein